MKDISILLVQHARSLRQELAAFLEESGAHVEAISSILEARHKIARQRPRFLILDVDDQTEDVLSFLSDLDSWHVETLVLASDTDLPHRLEFFERRVMDVIAKPVDLREISVRLRRLLRPRRTVEMKPQMDVTCGRATLDIRSRTLRNMRKKPVPLTASEFRLLYLLIQNEAQVVERAAITREVLGLTQDNASRSIDVMISKLRRKLDDVAAERYIRSVRSEGYMLISEERPDARALVASPPILTDYTLVSTT